MNHILDAIMRAGIWHLMKDFPFWGLVIVTAVVCALILARGRRY